MSRKLRIELPERASKHALSILNSSIPEHDPAIAVGGVAVNRAPEDRVRCPGRGVGGLEIHREIRIADIGWTEHAEVQGWHSRPVTRTDQNPGRGESHSTCTANWARMHHCSLSHRFEPLTQAKKERWHTGFSLREHGRDHQPVSTTQTARAPRGLPKGGIRLRLLALRLPSPLTGISTCLLDTSRRFPSTHNRLDATSFVAFHPRSLTPRFGSGNPFP